jgi:hypothetical protein
MQPTLESQARPPRRASQRVVRTPKRRNCIEQATFDPEHDIAIGGDHARVAPK